MAFLILYSPSLENERVVIAAMFPKPATKPNFSNFVPSAVDAKENGNQPGFQLTSLMFLPRLKQVNKNCETIHSPWDPKLSIFGRYMPLVAERACFKDKPGKG